MLGEIGRIAASLERWLGAGSSVRAEMAPLLPTLH
jgi:hypothetical protein